MFTKPLTCVISFDPHDIPVSCDAWNIRLPSDLSKETGYRKSLQDTVLCLEEISVSNVLSFLKKH